MGLLVDGKWLNQWYDTKASEGKFERKSAQFRNWVTADGSPGPSGKGGFAAEPGRYHLYVSHACPWAHRTMIFRSLKGLEQAITVSVVNWFMGDDGWHFGAGDGVVDDAINGAGFLHQVYTAADPDYSGRVTVPVLWDKQQNTIVCNESSEIIRMFNSAFDGVGAATGDYYPQALRPEIDALNKVVYDTLNNGV
ncbi:MAG TPA: glutathione S-transferase family protein, partial [Rhodospirillales bacterium]|nr:glutathione S-transferase family protein [Rhodospirillales bacterium]